MGFLIIITQTKEREDGNGEVVAYERTYKEAFERGKRILGEPLPKCLSASLCDETPTHITIAKEASWIHLQED